MTQEAAPEARREIQDPRPPRAQLFGYPIDVLTMEQARALVEENIVQARNFHVVTLNPEMIMQGDQDPQGLGRILKNAGLCLPDGAGVVWALRRNGRKETRRLPGIEFSETVLAMAARNGYRVALIGATAEALELARQTLQNRYAGLNIVYSHHGFFKAGSEEEARIVEACSTAWPQVVLVALGVPRQEKWIDAWRDKFHGTTFIGIGGSFDVWSGLTKRAPAAFRALNLEWLYRITSEPWRIRRIYKTLPMFVVKVLTSRP